MNKKFDHVISAALATTKPTTPISINLTIFQ